MAQSSGDLVRHDHFSVHPARHLYFRARSHPPDRFLYSRLQPTCYAFYLDLPPDKEANPCPPFFPFTTLVAAGCCLMCRRSGRRGLHRLFMRGCRRRNCGRLLGRARGQEHHDNGRKGKAKNSEFFHILKLSSNEDSPQVVSVDVLKAIS